MPGDEVEHGICNLFEPDNSLQGQHLSQAVGGIWPVLNYSQWVGKQSQIGAPLNHNLNDYNLQQLGCVRGHTGESLTVAFEQNHSQSTSIPVYSKSHTGNQQLNTNGFLLGCQNFERENHSGFFNDNAGYDRHLLSSRGFCVNKSQQENEIGPGDSPTLTTNSERSEITEASSDYNFLIGQQTLVEGQLPDTSQLHPMQQSGYNDMQLLQQQRMLKQLQELQRQQQLQQLGDVRQHNSLNQLSTIAKQAAGGQFSPLFNGTPVHDVPKMYRNWVQRGASITAQGASNKAVFSQDQGQALRLMGLVPQQQDTSLYGTPIANSRGNMSQFSHLQGMAHDSVNILTKSSGQVQKPLMQSSSFSNSFLGDQSTVHPNQVCLPQGDLMSKQGFQGRNISGQGPAQGLDGGVFHGNVQEGNTLQMNASVKEFNGTLEQAGWPGTQQTAKQFGSSQGLVPLDPIEEKILYNMDDNIWDASFGRQSDMVAGSFGNALEHTDLSNAFPSIQSGSWSALMQSAVAEASSSDTGLQEEWSGLTFQNTEQSTDNQISNFVDSEKQQTTWVDNNLQSASSFSSKPFTMLNDSTVSPSFPGFHPAGIQFPTDQREGMHQDGSHESVENRNPQQNPSIVEGQQVQSFTHIDNAWAGQMYSESNANHQRMTFAAGTEPVLSGTDNALINRENLQRNNFGAAPHSSYTKAHQTTSQHVPDGNRSDYMESIDNERMGKNQNQISNSLRVPQTSYEGVNDTYDSRENCYQRENPNDCYASKVSSDHEQGQFGQIKFPGNISSSVVNLDKGHLSDFQRNFKAPVEVPSTGDPKSNVSAMFHGSVVSDGANVTAQTSQNMLELLHKVDQSREDGNVSNFGFDMPRAESSETSVAQMYTQSSASQGFGLRLAPPSQRQPNSNRFLSPQSSPRTVSNVNSRQVNSESGEKNQSWLASQSPSQSLPPAHWDDKSTVSGHGGIPSYLNTQGNSIAAFASGSPYMRNQLQMHFTSNANVTSQSAQATLPGTASRYPPFNHVHSQDTSGQICANEVNQQFPVLEAVHVSQPSVMSGMNQQGEVSARPHNAWRNVPIQRQPLGMDALKVPSNMASSVNPSNSRMLSSSWAQQGSSNQTSPSGGYGSLEFGSSSMNSQGFDRGEEQLGKERLQQQISSKMPDASQTLLQGQEPAEKHISDQNVLVPSSSTAHSRQQDIDRIRHGYNHASAAPNGSISYGHPLQASHNFQQNYSLLHQVKAMTNAEIDPKASLMGQQFNEHNSKFRNAVDGGLNSVLRPNSLPPGDDKVLRLLAEGREGLSMKTLSQPAPQDMPSQEMVTFGQSNSQSQFSSSNVEYSHTEHSQVNLHMSSSWFKQYGTLRNGQMVPMYDARLAKTASGQLSLGKPSLSLHIHDQQDAADAGQGGGVWSSTATLIGSERFSAPCVLPSNVTNQNLAILRPKKRKIARPEVLPWHKEVTKSSKWLQNMSVAEQDWAQSTNRLFEKVEEEVEVVEDMLPVFRSKRRLILTTQLMQQLFHPAPSSIFSADATSHYDSVSYFVSKLSLGDACSLTYSRRIDLPLPLNDSNMTSEKVTSSERSTDQKFSDVVEEFTARAKKLENDFQRLDKVVSILDIRVDCQELERFGVINRFAKFHSRGPADSSGTSSSSGAPKPFPQRYVTALPMPRKLPEGVQCLSL